MSQNEKYQAIEVGRLFLVFISDTYAFGANDKLVQLCAAVNSLHCVMESVNHHMVGIQFTLVRAFDISVILWPMYTVLI